MDTQNVPGTKFNCSQCSDRSCAVAHLTESQLELLNNNSIETGIKKGEIILHAGAMNSSIIYLKTGFVKEYLSNRKNKNEILQIVKHHSYLGLQSLFGDKFNHFSYSALEDLKICYIDNSIFRQLIKENGDFAMEVLQCICKENLNLTHRMVNQNYKKADGRFADILLYLSQDIFENQTFELPFSRQELADLIGLSRESAIRVLSAFTSDGIIKTEGKKIEILNMDLVRKISENG